MQFFWVLQCLAVLLCILACNIEPFLIIIVLLAVLIFYWGILVIMFNRKRLFYCVDGCNIEVFAGHCSHYIIVNGEKADEIKTLFAFQICLNALRENLNVQVRIGQGILGNTISTRINGVIVKGYVTPRT